jgi:hypothetical protein
MRATGRRGTQATKSILAVVIAAAVSLAGCGGSGKKTTSSNATTPAASSTPTTPTTSSTPTTSGSTQVPKSERIDSPAYYNFALQVTNSSAPYLNTKQANFAAHCIQHRFLAAGMKTQGDVEKPSNADKLRSITTTCFLNAHYH